jgi:predicted dehydrogenase
VKKYRFAVIGCRHFHILEFIDEMIQSGSSFVGIYETENALYRNTITEKYQVKTFESIQDVFREKIDIVVCSDINSRKVEIIELCEKNKIHIIVDKPIVTTLEQYERLEKVISRGQIQIGMMLTERFQPVFQTLKSMLINKSFGDITHISMRKPHRLAKEKREPWFFSKELSVGIIIDLLVHDFDLIRWLTGFKVTKINGFKSKQCSADYKDFYDTTSLSVLLNDEIPVQLYADWHTPSASWTWGDGRVFITGTEGYAELRLNGDPYIEKKGLLFYGSHTEPIKKINIQESGLTVTNDFINRIEGNSHIVSHQNILDATMDTLLADEQVFSIKRKQY